MGLPLTVYPGTYTPGAETALHAAVDVINETWAQANTKLAAFEAKIAAITDPITGWLSTTAAPHISSSGATAPTVIEPVVTIPASIDTSTIYSDYTTQYNALRALMVSDLPKIFTDFFPNDGTTYAAAETWVQGAIANPNYGLPAAVQAQIMSDALAIIAADKLRAQDAVIQQFAARRFPLPPDQAASTIMQIEQKAQDAMAEAGRKITMMCVDMMKFAIEEAMKMRQLAIGSAMDYIKAQVAAPENASKVVGIGIDAQSKLISSVSAYYNARVAAGELAAKASQFDASQTQDAASKNQMADLALIEDRLKALLLEVQTFAQMATAMFNNLHASSGTGYNVSVS